MYINYGFNTQKEIYETAEKAVEKALKNENGEYIYLNHYVDSDSNLQGWEAYLADSGDWDGVCYAEINDWNGLIYWEEEWDIEAEIEMEV